MHTRSMIFDTPAAPCASNPPPRPNVGDVAGVVALLSGARERGLKFPKLWLQLPDASPVRITIAGEQSRTPGYLMVTDGKPFGINRYYGRVSPAGRFEAGRDAADGITELLTRLAAEPAKVAAEYGHLTGNCTFCGLKLSDARSIAVGYGQKCAQRFGLPWGAR